MDAIASISSWVSVPRLIFWFKFDGVVFIKGVADGLIERAAFMRCQLEDLEQYLNENGWTEPFKQGTAPAYDRARPAGQTYNTLNANYQKIIKQLDAMLPEVPAAADVTDDGFDDFANGRPEI